MRPLHVSIPIVSGCCAAIEHQVLVHVDQPRGQRAALAVAQGAKRDNVTIDAIGPETFTYRELVKVVGRMIGKKICRLCQNA